MVAWNLQGYTIEKMEHLSLVVVVPPSQLVLSYLLPETHRPSGTMLLGTPLDYLVL